MNMTAASCYIVTVLGALQVSAWYLGKNGIITSMIVGGITLILGYLFGKNRGGSASAPEPTAAKTLNNKGFDF